MSRRAPLNRETWFEFMKNHHCGLCANSGLINISGLRTPAGVELEPLVNAPCICPNGSVIAGLRRNLEDGRE